VGNFKEKARLLLNADMRVKYAKSDGVKLKIEYDKKSSNLFSSYYKMLYNEDFIMPGGIRKQNMPGGIRKQNYKSVDMPDYLLNDIRKRIYQNEELLALRQDERKSAYLACRQSVENLLQFKPRAVEKALGRRTDPSRKIVIELASVLVFFALIKIILPILGITTHSVPVVALVVSLSYVAWRLSLHLIVLNDERRRQKQGQVPSAPQRDDRKELTRIFRDIRSSLQESAAPEGGL
jgi:hypothetical protein